ncbi:hypothetical protein [Micromonospora sp. NPDC092111]|uniref:hypothetical protein n=1 Tax=Micromonospora sp. NPDC092111 TaxID=3364289 RepID=UPI003817FAE2
MELHREPGRQVLPAVCVLAGVVLLAVGGGLLRTLVAVGGIALGVVGLVGTLRPFRFVIDAEGLTVRSRGLRRRFGWAELDLVVLDRPPPGTGAPRLLAVPAPGTTAGLPLGARFDGRPAIELLDLAHVRESPEKIAAALAGHAGGRFRDARRDDGFPVPDFTTVLRGYSPDVVRPLVDRARAALDSGDPAQRRAARAELTEARATGLPVALRGYDVVQVDETLTALHAALAAEPTDRAVS